MEKICALYIEFPQGIRTALTSTFKLAMLSPYRKPSGKGAVRMRRMNARRKKTFPQWLREKRWAILVLGAAALLFFLVGLLARM